MIAAAVLVGFAALAAVALLWVRSSDALIRKHERSKVVVEIKSGETFAGTLAAADAKSLTLHSAKAIQGESTQALGIDGVLLIPRGDVKFLQRP